MRLNVFLSCIAIAMAGLVGYLVYSIAEGREGDLLCGIGGAVCFMSILLPVMGMHYDSGRLGVNIRVMCLAFFVLFLVSHVCFALLGIKTSYYIVTNGILLLVYGSVFYKMQRLKEI